MMGATTVVLAGGGTAGHTSPLIATAEQLREVAEVDLVCVGTPKGLESRVIPQAGLRLEMIQPVPLPRRLSLELLAVPVRLFRAVREARQILRHHNAKAVLGFGAYVSLPVYLAAISSRVPLVIHEGNAVPGLANRIAARFTGFVATTFPGTPLRNARTIGLPLRKRIVGLDRDSARELARSGFGLPASGPVLLVSGGSQGARSINQATIATADRLLAAGISVLHILGESNFTESNVAQRDAHTGAVYLPVPYVQAMEDAYAAADLMVGRAGAGTVMETAVTGLPAIFVPLPHGNGEQARNAMFLVEAEGGEMIADSELNADLLLERVTLLIANPVRLRQMSATCRRLAPADAAATLARMVLLAARAEG